MLAQGLPTTEWWRSSRRNLSNLLIAHMLVYIARCLTALGRTRVVHSRLTSCRTVLTTSLLETCPTSISPINTANFKLSAMATLTTSSGRLTSLIGGSVGSAIFTELYTHCDYTGNTLWFTIHWKSPLYTGQTSMTTADRRHVWQILSSLVDEILEPTIYSLTFSISILRYIVESSNLSMELILTTI